MTKKIKLLIKIIKYSFEVVFVNLTKDTNLQKTASICLKKELLLDAIINFEYL